MTFGITLGVLLAGAVLPLLLPAYFPSVDLWNHLAVHEAQRQAVSGTGPLGALYTLDLAPYPYVGGYLALAVFRPWMDPLLAGVMVLALSHVMVVLGARALLRALDVPGELVLLAFAACFSVPTWYGFLSYGVGIGPALAVTAACVRAMERRDTRWSLAAAAGLCGVLLCHVEAWGTAGLFAGGMALGTAPRVTRLLRLALVSSPSVILFGAWMASHVEHGSGPLRVDYGPLKDRFGAWQAYHLFDEGFAGMVPALVVAGAVVGLVRALVKKERVDGRVVGLLLAATALHLGMPKSVDGGAVAAWGQSIRTGAFTTCAAVAGWMMLPVAWRRAGGVVVVAGILLMDLQAYLHARAFSSLVEPLDARLRTTRPGATGVVLTAPGEDRLPGGSLHHLEHVSSLWVVRGAVTHQFFQVPGTRLVPRDPSRLPPNPEELRDTPACRWAPRLDHVILQGSPEGALEKLQAAGFTASWSHARWTWLDRAEAVPPCKDEGP